MCVVKDIIVKYCTFHSYMIFNPTKKSFDMKPYFGKNPGVYFILEIDNKEKVHIHKVGMADGRHGLYGRMKTYWNNNSVAIANGKDKTMSLIDRVMNDQLKDKVLAMYYLEVPTTEITLFGYNGLKQSAIRDLEYNLSITAESEGHPLLLSKFH